MNITELYNNIINTPLIELKNIEKHFNLKSKIYAKAECYNLTGSAKDRTAYFIILKALEEGLIKEGSTIIEPTSGNTGISMSYIASKIGLKAIIVMPSNMSKERIKMIESYGGSVVLTDAKLGMSGSIDKALELNKEIDDSFILAQFNNKNNVLAHYSTTGKEIFEELKEVDALVAGIGTGGTISGSSKYLKEQKEIYTLGVEPEESPLISKGYSGPHLIQGIGANFIPNNYKKEYVDDVVGINSQEAIKMAKLIDEKEEIPVGISSGAAMIAAINLANEKKYQNIVVIFPDNKNRYLSILE